jgi:hypothetical protein
VAQDAMDRARDHARDADRELDEAARKVAFADEVEAVTRRRTGLGALAAEVARARTRGWVWGPEWERTLAELERTGEEVARDVRTETSAAASRMKSRLDGCRSKLTRTSVTAANLSALAAIEEEARSIASAASAEEQRIRAITGPFVEPYDRLEGEVSAAHTHLEPVEVAKFQLGAGERPWLTAEAAWKDAPGGEVSGLLYLTDKRIRFEQKETVATKKFLFITTASEEKHQCLIDEPVGNIARSDDATKGLLFKDQLVTIGWQNTRITKSTFDINSGGTAKEWDTRIEELRSGQLAHRMTEAAAASPTAGMPIDPPTTCTGCAAALDAPVRGATTLVCRYCGQRHDLRF